MGKLNEIIKADTKSLPLKNPAVKQHFKLAEGVISTLKNIEDWPKLDTAIAAMLDDQTELVVWWGDNVTVRQGPGRGIKTRAGLGGFSLVEAEQLTGIQHQKVSRWRVRLSDREAYADLLRGAAYRKAMGETDLRGASGTGENDWHTPPEYLALAREVLGAFDLDPASSEAAQLTVKAERYYTSTGLTERWAGRVWLNPPYSKALLADFVGKLVDEVGAGNVTAAIMLTHNYTDTRWFHLAASKANAICFTRGRVKFVNALGDEAAPTQGQAFFYFGDKPAIFIERFSEIGFVMIVA